MGLRIIDKKFASAVAIAGAVSLVSVPAWAAGDRETGATQQPGAAQYQMERQPGQEMHQQISSEQIRQVQQKLQEEGHNPGPIDGVWGPQTQAAVRDFQQQNNLQATGQLDQRTMQELGVGRDHISGEDLPPIPEAAKPGTQGVDQEPGQQQQESGQQQVQ